MVLKSLNGGNVFLDCVLNTRSSWGCNLRPYPIQQKLFSEECPACDIGCSITAKTVKADPTRKSRWQSGFVPSSGSRSEKNNAFLQQIMQSVKMEGDEFIEEGDPLPEDGDHFYVTTEADVFHLQTQLKYLHPAIIEN